MGRRRDDGEERERPSWREIDHLRDHPEERNQRGRAQIERPGSGYLSYKDQLNQMFQSGGVGKLVAERIGDTELPQTDGDTRAALVRNLRSAATASERHAALDALLAAGEVLPEDSELLALLVDHPREEVLRQVLQRLAEVLPRQPLKRKASFVVRLQTLELTAEQPATLSLVARLLEALD